VATLDTPDGPIVLTPRMLIGRHPASDLVLDDPRVSGRHAEIRWTLAGWEIKDLGSRNGTRVGDQFLDPGLWHRLRRGEAIAFGSSDLQATPSDLTPPSFPVALDAVRGELRQGDGQRLDLGDAAIVARGGGWEFVRGDRRYDVHDDMSITVDDRTWRIFLPAPEVATVDAVGQPVLGNLTLRFEVSLDEEHVRIVARFGPHELDLGERVHHYLLLTLARQRLADREAGVPEAEEGWLVASDLHRMLATDRVKMNVEIFRARKQLEKAGILDAADIVERRAERIRLGLRSVEIDRA
jgi:hypothetical protein